MRQSAALFGQSEVVPFGFDAEALPQEVQDSLGKATPFPPRLGRPDEFAQLVRSIVENAMINGEVIRLDGAVRLSAK